MYMLPVGRCRLEASPSALGTRWPLGGCCRERGLSGLCAQCQEGAGWREADAQGGLSGRCPLALPRPGLVSVLLLKLLGAAGGRPGRCGGGAHPLLPPPGRAEGELPGTVVMATWWPLQAAAGEGHLSACRLRSALSRLGAKTASFVPSSCWSCGPAPRWWELRQVLPR